MMLMGGCPRCWRVPSSERKRSVADFFASILRYFEALFAVIWHALTLDPLLYEFVAEQPLAGYLVMGVIFLGGASVLLGQSAVLFINRVRLPPR